MGTFGGGLGRVEEHAHVGTIDVIAGIGGALAATAALFMRARAESDGAAAAALAAGTLVARASLASCAQIVQYPFCCGRLEREARRASTRLGPECRGETPLLRVRRRRVSYIAPPRRPTTPSTRRRGLASRPPRRRSRERSPPPRRRVRRRRRGATMTTSTRSAPTGGWRRRSRMPSAPHGGGVGRGPPRIGRCRRAASLARVAPCCAHADARRPRRRLVPVGRAARPPRRPLVLFAPVSVRPAHARVALPLAPAPPYGAHTREVLGELGIDPEPLLARGAAATKWSDDRRAPPRATGSRGGEVPGLPRRARQAARARVRPRNLRRLRDGGGGGSRCPTCTSSLPRRSRRAHGGTRRGATARLARQIDRRAAGGGGKGTATATCRRSACSRWRPVSRLLRPSRGSECVNGVMCGE